MSEQKQFLIGLFVIIGFSCVLILVLDFYKDRHNDELIKHGDHTLALYAYNASRPGTSIYQFKFKLANQEYLVSSSHSYKTTRQVPFKEIPVVVCYDKEDPSDSILLPDEEFNYKGFRIKWEFNNDEKYYEMKILN